MTVSMAEWLFRVPRVLRVKSLNPRAPKSYTALQTFCHRFSIYAISYVVLAQYRGDGHRKLITGFSVIR